MTALQEQGRRAKAASYTLAAAGTARKNAALEAIADILTERRDEWLAANAEDIAAAREAGMRSAMLDRLTLTEERIAGIVEAVRQVAALPDPIGKVDKMETRPNGLIIGRRRVPLGVVAIIFEARPNVTVDAAALCLKSGNVCILRGGKEAIRSNRKAAELMRTALASAGLPEDCVSLVQDTSHETANELMHLDGSVDVLIPRGGAGLIRTVVENSRIPVIETGTGNCHIFVDESADFDMAADIIFNAKTQRIGVCNACESIVVHEKIIDAFLPKLKKRLDEKEVELRGDEKALQAAEGLIPAAEEDWGTEYLDYILSVKTVSGIDEAIAHINKYNTGHSEAIVTSDYANAQRFLNEIDAAAVYVNASTRFTDGFEFGFGAEIGISTQKLHARGPMGLDALTSGKYIIYGNGQVR